MRLSAARLVSRGCLIAAALLLTTVPCAAQQTQENSTGAIASPAAADAGTLYLKFLDARTGGGVQPDKIIINNLPAKFVVEAGSLVQMQLASGKHELRVEAAGYDPMNFAATVSGNATPVMQIELDPSTPTDYEPVAPDAAILEGNVSDADTGALLDNVAVTLTGSDRSTRTNSSGYYRFDVVTGQSSADAQPAITLEVKAAGYTSLRLKNVALAPGERRRMPVRLELVTSGTLAPDVVEIDKGVTPGGGPRALDWTFDATVH